MILTQYHVVEPSSTLTSNKTQHFNNRHLIADLCQKKRLYNLRNQSSTTIVMQEGTTAQLKRRATSPPYLSQNSTHSQVPTRTHSSSFTEPIMTNSSDMEDVSMPVSPNGASLPYDSYDDPTAEHIIHLSRIEHTMPRAYIRVCLAYRLRSDNDLNQVVAKLNNFIRNTVNAKPYLAGYVRPADKNRTAGPAEIHFSNDDFLSYPDVEVRHLCDDNGNLMDFDELDRQGFPPSKLHPDKVAVLPAVKADEKRAPVFRTQANFVRNGLIVSFYLHHCISDGTGLGLLVTGAIQVDDFAFKRHLIGQPSKIPCVGARLAAFANRKSIERTSLSWSDHNMTLDRELLYKRLNHSNGIGATNPPGRGCVISISDATIEELRNVLSDCLHGVTFSRHDVLQALIWRHMARARLPIVRQHPDITTSKLLIPVNIRNRLKERLSDLYFGAAVDFASAEFDLETLANGGTSILASAAQTIKLAINRVDEPYIRQSIALAGSLDTTIDVRDLLASNMNRVTGADMYITSWEKMGLYEAELDMGLGRPAWVRKPWSRDPGSCIILPRNPEKQHFEVVIQMTELDMHRLLTDQEFMQHVGRVID